jgi:ABC-type multidrug transport system fused ATPase/permease subunit
VVCFTISGENLTSRLRELAFKAMLRQEIGWFDEERNSSGALVTRLADDAAKVQGATGTRLGILVETMCSMLVALVIAFVYSWVLTLVILGVVPIVLIASSLEVKALSGHTAANKKSLEKAGKVS